MLRTPHTDIPDSIGLDHAAVQAQLAKILGSPHFRQSKRSQGLLRCVVEAALAGEQNSLKERQIGAAVFGRDTAYDTAQDPVVRNAAIEVRKRLAQYYLEPEHTCELRIELPTGSYLPSFTVEAPAAEPPKAVEPPRRHASRRVYVAALILVLMGAAGAVLWGARTTPGSQLDAFWEPLFRDRKTIQIAIGQPTRLYRFVGPRMEELNRVFGGPPTAGRPASSESISGGEMAWVAPEYLFMRDALSAFKVASWVQARGRAYQLMPVAQTNYSRIRHEPLVAIGAFNNAWSMRVTAELRFVCNQRTIDGVAYHYISDRRNPAAFDWKVAQPAGGTMGEDYAIVTRVFDSATEKTVISVAGIETYGTLAASEFVTDAEYLGPALAAAPRDWRRRNVQFVLGTKIIDGTPGPPRVLASYFW
ncbi:MAG: hypothetical protein ABI759_04670 [Candidatus Solibacter sp.]